MIKDKNTVQELNLEQKVTIKSIANWTTGFKRIETNGDVTIPANGTVRLQRSEIITQIQNGNRLLTGIDDRGSHATLYVDDKPTRIEVDFESEDGKQVQNILTVDAVKKLFEYKTLKTFEEKLKDLVVTRAEKFAILEIIKREKLNDFEKIRIVENYVEHKI